MRSTAAVSLKARINQMLWIGNALVGAAVALQGAVICFTFYSSDAQLSALIVRAGALLAGASTMLLVYSLRKARSISASRN